MLREFSCRNFHCFAEEQSVSLTTSSPMISKDGTVLSVPSEWGDGLLTILTAVGPNASGKTNLLKTLPFLSHFIHFSHSAPKNAPITSLIPCAFLAKEEPSEFRLEVEDLPTGLRYRYELSLTRERVLSEYLFRRVYPRGRWVRLLGREYNPKKNGYDHTLHASMDLTDELFKKSLRTNASFFSIFHILETDVLADFFTLVNFETNITRSGRVDGVLHELGKQRSLGRLHTARSAQMFMGELLGKLGTGVTGLEVIRQEVAADSLEESGPRVRILASVAPAKQSKGGTTKAVVQQRGHHYDALFTHRHGDESFTLPLSDQSGGTRELLFLLDDILDALFTGSVLVYDELECNLHPLLLPHLTRLFTDPKTNPHGAQLVCSCHAIDLLRQLEKEQILLVEKDSAGNSRADRLDSFVGVRRDENYVARYLAGAYGALPDITEGLTSPKLWKNFFAKPRKSDTEQEEG